MNRAQAHKHTNRVPVHSSLWYSQHLYALSSALEKNLFFELDDVDDNGDDDKGIRSRTFVHEIVYKTKMNQLTIIKQKYFVFSLLS